jgi:galactonate dehydratase
VEHHWQSMYVHSFTGRVLVMGSSDLRDRPGVMGHSRKVIGMPVYKLLGGPRDARGVRGYYHASARNREQLMKLRETAVAQGVSCFQVGHSGYLRMDRDTPKDRSGR